MINHSILNIILAYLVINAVSAESTNTQIQPSYYLVNTVDGSKANQALSTQHYYLIKQDNYSNPNKNLSSEQLINFAVGRSLFKKLWVAAPTATKASDGLGPLYNARSCFMCHANAGRGKVPNAGKRAVSIFMRLSTPAQTEQQKECLQALRCSVIAEPSYGTQLQNFAVTGLAGEGDLKIEYRAIPIELVGDEIVNLQQPYYRIEALQYGPLHPDVMMSPRLAPALVGMGLLDQISEASILAYSDPNDDNNDGISGKANRVWSQQFKQVRLGRFGYKAGIASLDEQNQAALVNDIGLSTPLFSQAVWGNCTKLQTRCRRAPHGDDASQGSLEAPQKVTDAILFYTQNLHVPKQRQPQNIDVIAGRKLFKQLNCQACHRESYPLKQGEIHPYSDLLLHDMGEDLADQRPEGLANGQEWRTTPLWGIGLTESVNKHPYYLHDGRARTLQEAILWHGGEAQTARDHYTKLPKLERDKLLRFLQSL